MNATMPSGKAATGLPSLTPIQLDTLLFIAAHIHGYGYAPTMREIAEHFERSHISIFERVEMICNKGFLAKTADRARGLALTEGAERWLTDRENSIPTMDLTLRDILLNRARNAS